MTLTLHLPDKLGEYVASQVDSGFYADAEEVVRDAVRHQAQQQLALDANDDHPALVDALLAGVRSPKRPLTDDVWNEMRSRAVKLAAQ